MSITKGDMYHKKLISNILQNGTDTINDAARYADGTPCIVRGVNHILHTYDISKNESPLVTLRPIMTRKAIGEILWIYQDQSNDLKLLKEKYGINWWTEWDIGDGTIGSCYGETVRKHDIMNKLLTDIIENPDGRRHIINLYQYSDFDMAHGLKPCFLMAQFSVSHRRVPRSDDPSQHTIVDYLDMLLYTRSSDFIVAGAINAVQYLTLLHLVAKHCGYKVGKFSIIFNNVHIYDRNIIQAKELLKRDPINLETQPYIWLNPYKNNFFDFTLDDIRVVNYPVDEIMEKNPQLKFDLGMNKTDYNK